jgi:hypothetical protein
VCPAQNGINLRRGRDSRIFTEYSPRRVKVEWTFGPGDEEYRQILRSALVKAEVWHYEEEVRLFTKTDQCEEKAVQTCTSAAMEHFWAFNREWVKSVDFGVCCPPVEIRRIIDLLKMDYPAVILRRAKIHETEYAFEYNEFHATSGHT